MSLLRRKLLRDLRAHRGQVFSVALTSFLGVALFGGTSDAFQDLKASYALMFERTRFADVVAIGGDAASIAADVRSMPGVERVSVREVADVPLRVGGRKFRGRVIGVPPGNDNVDRVIVLSGRDLSDGDDEVLVEQHLAGTYGLTAGRGVDVLDASGWRTMRVLGIAASSEYLWPARSRQEILVPPSDFGVVFSPDAALARLPREARHSETLVLFTHEADRETLSTRVRDVALRHGAADTYTQADQPSNAALREDINGLGELSVLFPILFLGASALAAYVLIARLVRTQRSQIGLLLANGFSPRTVVAHYLSYGIVTTLAGGIPGAAAGALLGATIAQTYTHELSIPLNVVQIHPQTALVGVLLTLAAGMLAAIIPARAAARMLPAEAMHPVGSLARGGQSFIERALPIVRHWPTRRLMILRGIGRSPARSAATLIGSVLAMTLVLVSWGMLDTTEYALDRQFTTIDRSDARLIYTTPPSAEQIASLTRIVGIAAAEPSATRDVVVRSAAGSYRTQLVGLEQNTAMRRFPSTSGEEGALPADGILLGFSLRTRLHLQRGDPVDLLISPATQPVRTHVAGFVDEPLGTYAYISLPRLASLTGNDAAVAESALVRFTAGVDPDRMRERLTKPANVAAYLDTQALARTARQYMGLFYVFVGVMLALGAVLAFTLIFITMSVNVAERSSEAAILQANGMAARTVGRLFAAEGLLLTVVGVVPGLAIGYAVAWAFMRSFSSDLFSFALHMRATTLALTAGGIVLTAVLSQRPALRLVGEVDVPRAVRELAA